MRFILLDVVMPDMDGFETAALIRQRPALERTPIIFVSSHDTSETDRLKAYALGAVDFVVAPIVPEILRAKVSVFIELYRNRTELAKANEQLRGEMLQRQAAQEQALQAERMAAVGEMVNGLSHESRNVLQQIQASVEMLSRRIQTAAESALIAEIQKAHDRLHRLLEEVRYYAAPLKLAYSVRELGQLWQEAWNQLAPMRKGREASLSEDTDHLDLRCLVDPTSIKQVFRNLFENALALCKDPVRIDVVCEAAMIKGQPAFRVRVSDNGEELKAEQKQRIFEPFFTTKSARTGLGLAIAKRVVEAHGGEIALLQDHPSGTAIDVVLPRGQ